MPCTGGSPADERDPALAALACVAVLAPTQLTAEKYAVAAWGEPRASGRFALTPAPALFVANCLHELKPQRGSRTVSAERSRCEDALAMGLPLRPDRRLPPPDWPSDAAQSFAVLAGVGEDHATDATTSTIRAQPRSCRTGKELRERPWATFLGQLSEWLAVDERPLCRYPHEQPSGRDLNAGVTREEYVEGRAGRLLLLGADFSGSRDVEPVPPFDFLPGLYVHAMATDNLIEWGLETAAVDEQYYWWRLKKGDMLDIALAALSALIIVGITRRVANRMWRVCALSVSALGFAAVVYLVGSSSKLMINGWSANLINVVAILSAWTIAALNELWNGRTSKDEHKSKEQ